MTTFELYVAGVLVDRRRADLEIWPIPDAITQVIADIAAHQANLATTAAETGRPWLVDVTFDDGEHVRFGTDPDGMVEPIDLEGGWDRIADALNARWADR